MLPLNQPKGSTIGILQDGKTVQEAFDIIGRGFDSASEIRGKNLKGFKGFYLRNKFLFGVMYQSGGRFFEDTDDFSSPDDGIFTLVSADGARFKRDVGQAGEVQMDWFFNPDTDGHDYSLVINRVASYYAPGDAGDTTLSATRKRGAVVIGPGGTRTCLTPAVMNTYDNSIDWKNTTLDFSTSGITSGYYTRVKTSRNSFMNNLSIVGPLSRDSSRTVSGILFSSNAPNIKGIPCMGLTVNNLSVDRCARSLEFGNNAYILTFNNASLNGGYKGIYTNGVPKNAGENITFHNSRITNGVQYIDASIPIKFTETSFDYSGFVREADMVANQGMAMFNTGADLGFTRCHFEWGNENSRWMGPVFKGDVTISIKDSVYWNSGAEVMDSGATYRRQTITAFHEAPNRAVGLLDIDGLEVANSDLNGVAGSWGTGQIVNLRNIKPGRHLNMYKNYWKAPASSVDDYGFYMNSKLPTMTPATVQDGTADSAVALYRAVTKAKESSSDSNLNSFGYDGTSSTLSINTTSTWTGNNASIELFAEARPMEFYQAYVAILPRSIPNSADGDRVSISVSVEAGVFNSAGDFVTGKRLCWPLKSTGVNQSKVLRTNGLTEYGSAATLPAVPVGCTHVRLRITLTDFYVSATGNTLGVNIRCPRLEAFSATTQSYAAKTH